MEKKILKNIPELHAGRAEEIRNVLQMELTPQFNERFSGETLNGEKIRAAILSGMLIQVFLWLILAPRYMRDAFPVEMFQVIRGVQAHVLLALALLIFWLYETGFALLIRHFSRKKKNLPAFTPFGNTFAEISFISTIVYFMSLTDMKAEVLHSPLVWFYFIFIALSAFRLKFLLCLFTGIIAATEYSLVYFLVSRPVHSIEQFHSFLMPGIHAGRAAILLLAGLVTGFVTLMINSKIVQSLKAVEERSAIINIFGQHVSPAVVNKLLEQKGDLGSEVRHVCTMFLDIRNFTAFSEGREPQEIVDFLNHMFDFQIEIINGNGGIINKFLGDGFMAVFGAPVSDGRDSINAVKASLEILERLNREIASGRMSETRIGIGLHAGRAVTGHVGSSLRREYTIIGDVVNLASRIEQLNKRLGSSILVSATVWEAIAGEGFFYEDMGLMEIRGHRDPVRVYRLA